MDHSQKAGTLKILYKIIVKLCVYVKHKWTSCLELDPIPQDNSVHAKKPKPDIWNISDPKCFGISNLKLENSWN